MIETKRSIINSECSKLAQKVYKTRHDWVGKVIHWELCNQVSVLENDTHKFLWVCDIHTDHLISARRSDLIIINNNKKKKEEKEKTERSCKIVDFAVPADH